MHADHQPLSFAEARGNATVLVPVPSLPSFGQFTIQVAFLLGAPVTGGIPAQGIPCGGTETYAVTPALYIDY